MVGVRRSGVIVLPAPTKRQLKLHLLVNSFVVVVAVVGLWGAVSEDGFEWPLMIVILLIAWYLFKLALILSTLLRGKPTGRAPLRDESSL